MKAVLKMVNSCLTRARARAYSQEFYAFFCHICHAHILKPWYSTRCTYVKQILTENDSDSPFFCMWQQICGVFLPLIHSIGTRFFALLEQGCDRCDSKKTQLLGYIRARCVHEERTAHEVPFSRTRLHTSCFHPRHSPLIWYIELPLKKVTRNYLHFFADFSLFGAISPYILIGGDGKHGEGLGI